MKWNKGRSKGYNVVVMNDESEKWTTKERVTSNLPRTK